MIDKIRSFSSVVEIKNIIYKVNDNIVILVNNIIDVVCHNVADKKYERCLHKIYIYITYLCHTLFGFVLTEQ